MNILDLAWKSLKCWDLSKGHSLAPAEFKEWGGGLTRYFCRKLVKIANLWLPTNAEVNCR